MQTTKSRNPWVIFVITFITALTFAAGQFKVPPTLPVVAEELGIGMALGGLLMSIVAITAIVLALFGGFFTVRFKPRNIGLFAIVCAFAGNVIGFLSPSFEILLLSRLIEGVGYGLITTTAPTIIAEWFPDESKRGRPMALYSMWVALGMIIIFNGTNPIIAAFGWKMVWAFCAVAFVVVFILFFLFVHDPADTKLGQTSASIKEQAKDIAIEARSGKVWMLTVVFTIFGLGCAAFTTFAPTFCVEKFGMDLMVANSSLSLLNVSMIVGGFIMALIIGFTKDLPRVMVIVTIITGVFFAVSFMLTDQAMVIPFVLVYGLVLQTIPPTVFAVAPAAANSPRTVGVTIGIATAGDHVGAFVGTVCLGAIVEFAGSNGVNNWDAAIPAMAAFAVIGILGAFGFNYFMKRDKELKAAQPE